LVELSDVDRFIEEGFCEHNRCSRNEEGYCYLWIPLDYNDDEYDCVVNSDGKCFDACIYPPQNKSPNG